MIVINFFITEFTNFSFFYANEIFSSRTGYDTRYNDHPLSSIVQLYIQVCYHFPFRDYLDKQIDI